MSNIKTALECVSCGVITGDVDVYDLPFISENKCWSCVFNDCELCEGAGIVNGWSSPDGDFDFEWCDCNPLHITLEY